MNGEGHEKLGQSLVKTELLVHPFVECEVSVCSTSDARPDHAAILLENLQQAREDYVVPRARHWEVEKFIEEKELMGRGLNYVDVHLLFAMGELLAQDEDPDEETKVEPQLWAPDGPLRQACIDCWGADSVV